VGSYTSLELAEALREGYRVCKFYRALEYTEVDSKLFRSYMREFLAEKFHASGFAEGIKGNEEAEDKFIDECMEKFGIKIEREKMKTNKGLRTLVKLMVNNLW
jgi:hypothetical protein